MWLWIIPPTPPWSGFPLLAQSQLSLTQLLLRRCQDAKITVCSYLSKNKNVCDQIFILRWRECNKKCNFTISRIPSGTYWKIIIFSHFQIIIIQ